MKAKKLEPQPDLLPDADPRRYPHSITVHPDNLDAIQPVLALFNAYLLNLSISHNPTAYSIQFISTNSNAPLITNLLQFSQTNPEPPPWTGHIGHHPDF